MCAPSFGFDRKLRSASLSPPANRRNGPKDAENQPAPVPHTWRSGATRVRVPLFARSTSSPGSNTRSKRTAALRTLALPVLPFPENRSYSPLGTMSIRTNPSASPLRSQVLQSCLAARASLGPTNTSATDRRNEDFPEPLSPRMTCQPGPSSSGSHARYARERILRMRTLRMYISNPF